MTWEAAQSLSAKTPQARADGVPEHTGLREVCRVCHKPIDKTNCMAVYNRIADEPPRKELIAYECWEHSQAGIPEHAPEPDAKAFEADVLRFYPKALLNKTSEGKYWMPVIDEYKKMWIAGSEHAGRGRGK